MRAEELNVNGAALENARLLQAQFPWVVFTSGRRDPYAQCHAMASNVLTARDAGNWNWVAQVYGKEPQFQAWVDANPTVKDLDMLADAFFRQVWMPLPPEIRGRFAHPAGRAFDVQPPAIADHDALLQTAIRRLPRLQCFLTSEGGLKIYHCQFLEDV